MNAAMAIVGLGIGGVFLVIGLVRWNFALANYGPAVVLRWSGGWLVVGGLLLLVGAVGAAWLVRWNRMAVVVHDGGLQIKRGKRSRSIPWTAIDSVQVSGVRYRLILGSRSILVIETNDARKTRFTNTLVGLDHVAAAVKRNVYPRLLTQFTRYLRDGQPVPFGPLVIGPEGIARGARKLAWSEVAGAQLGDGRLIITPTKDHGGPWRIDARKLPNPEVCLQLVRHRAASRQGGARV